VVNIDATTNRQKVLNQPTAAPLKEETEGAGGVTTTTTPNTLSTPALNPLRNPLVDAPAAHEGKSADGATEYHTQQEQQIVSFFRPLGSPSFSDMHNLSIRDGSSNDTVPAGYGERIAKELTDAFNAIACLECGVGGTDETRPQLSKKDCETLSLISQELASLDLSMGDGGSDDGLEARNTVNPLDLSTAVGLLADMDLAAAVDEAGSSVHQQQAAAQMVPYNCLQQYQLFQQQQQHLEKMMQMDASLQWRAATQESLVAQQLQQQQQQQRWQVCIMIGIYVCFDDAMNVSIGRSLRRSGRI